jgi:hypothetical protein
MRIHADPDLKHWAFFDETPEEKYEAETISVDYIIFSYF